MHELEDKLLEGESFVFLLEFKFYFRYHNVSKANSLRQKCRRADISVRAAHQGRQHVVTSR
jgi:hypothetical protein